MAGQSAGGQSTLIHLQAPATSGKFQSCIIESAPVALPFKTISEGLQQTREFVLEAGCFASTGAGSDQPILDCLRKLSPEQILKAQAKIRTFGTYFLSAAQPWGPVIDYEFVLSQPIDAIQSKNVPSRIPVLWGVMEEEALLYIRTLFKRSHVLMNVFIRKIMSSKVDKIIFNRFYPPSHPDWRDSVSDVVTDVLFRCPSQLAAQKLNENGVDNVWNYVWHRTLTLPPTHFGNICSDRACHSVEIPYVFHNFDMLGTNISQKDIHLSNAIIDYYGKFIKNHNPNSYPTAAKAYHPHWPRTYSSGRYQTLGFKDSGSIGVETGVPKERCDLWKAGNFTFGNSKLLSIG